MPIADPRFLLILLPVVGLFYALRSGKYRTLLVLLASYLYYLTFPAWFLPILLGMTVFAYLAGLLIERLRGTRAHWPVVAIIVAMALSPMIVLKALSDLPAVPLIYPVGLSFYTFTSLAYLIDVALDVVDAERRPHRIAVATSFFPVLTLGPLLRTSYFSRLDFTRSCLDRQRLLNGLSEIIVGMALKVGFADVLATSSDAVYANVSTASGVELFSGSAVELFQIYADWQAYSLIAIGSARLFGIDFPPNFPQPYLSTNIGDFWRRWGVSLVNWFRDYVFTPVQLQFKTGSRLAVPVATFVTFTLFGAWHVRWGWLNYVAYGAVNGLLLIYSQTTLAARDNIWRALHVPVKVVAPIRVVVTFFVVVLTVPLARAMSLPDALHIYAVWFSPRILDDLTPMAPHMNLATVVPLILILIAADIVVLRQRTLKEKIPPWLSVPVLGVCVVIIAWHTLSGLPTPPFVYYRF